MTSTRSRSTTRPRASARPKNPGRASAKPARKQSKPARKQTRATSGNRFEAKRLDNERRAGLRRLKIVLGLTAVTSLAVGFIAFINSTWFDVDSVSVVGTERSDPALITSAAGIELGQGLLELDLDHAARQVELVPWIGVATIDRRWTGEIVISVEERPPSAALPAGNRFALVDDHGRQLEIVDRRPEGYLPIRGVEGSGVAGEPAPAEALPVIALLDALPAGVEAEVSGVTVADRHLYLDLVVGGRADFGDGSDLGPKLQSLETMLTKVDLTCLDTIDVRVPSAPVVTRRGSPASDGQDGGDGTTQSDPSEEPDSGLGDC